MHLDILGSSDILHLRSLNNIITNVINKSYKNGGRFVTVGREVGPTPLHNMTFAGVSGFAFQGTYAHIILGRSPASSCVLTKSMLAWENAFFWMFPPTLAPLSAVQVASNHIYIYIFIYAANVVAWVDFASECLYHVNVGANLSLTNAVEVKELTNKNRVGDSNVRIRLNVDDGKIFVSCGDATFAEATTSTMNNCAQECRRCPLVSLSRQTVVTPACTLGCVFQRNADLSPLLATLRCATSSVDTTPSPLQPNYSFWHRQPNSPTWVSLEHQRSAVVGRAATDNSEQSCCFVLDPAKLYCHAALSSPLNFRLAYVEEVQAFQSASSTLPTYSSNILCIEGTKSFIYCQKSYYLSVLQTLITQGVKDVKSVDKTCSCFVTCHAAPRDDNVGALFRVARSERGLEHWTSYQSSFLSNMATVRSSTDNDCMSFSNILFNSCLTEARHNKRDDNTPSNVLIVGGLGGIGGLFRTWFAKHGCNCVLLGRSGRGKLDPVQHYSKSIRCDISKLSESYALRLGLEEKPDWIINSGGLLQDASIMRQTPRHLRNVLASKTIGSANLTFASTAAAVSSLLLFSSISGYFGLPGQANYSYANANLDKMALSNRNMGFQTTSVAWGAWAGAGMAVADEKIVSHLAALGLGTISPEQGLCLLGSSLVMPSSYIFFSQVNWSLILQKLPLLQKAISIESSSRHENISALPDTSSSLAAIKPRTLSENSVTSTILQSVMDLSGSPVNRESSFLDTGLDSLAVVELGKMISSALGLEVSVTDLYDFPTPEMLAKHLLSENNSLDGSVNDSTLLRNPFNYVSSNEHVVKSAQPASFISKDNAQIVEVIGYAGTMPSLSLLDPFDDAITKQSRCGATVEEDLADVQINFMSAINDVASFDNALFSLSTAEADMTDPQQRKLLETAYVLLMDKGSSAKETCSHYVGAQHMEYIFMLPQKSLTAQSATSFPLSVVAGRIAFVFNLRGEAVAVDTACSSSLVALQQASQSMTLMGEAIVSGVSIISSRFTTKVTQLASMLTMDGRCKSLDAAADGYVRAEACVALDLRTRPSCEAELEPASGHGLEGRSALAVLGTAVNQDGRSASLTAPNGPSQQRVIRAALEAAALMPGDVSLLEMHGTGTALGDPIEVGAAMQALCGGTGARVPSGRMQLTAAKSRFGHAEPAAGMIGLVSGASVLTGLSFNAVTHLRHVNPYVAGALGGSGRQPDRVVGVARQPAPASAGSSRGLTMGVSAFAFMGTNAHALVSNLKSDATAPAALVCGNDIPWKKHVSWYVPHAGTYDVLRYPAILAASSQSFAASFLCSLNGMLANLLSEHVVQDKKVVPGSFTLSLLQDACRLLQPVPGRNNHMIQNVAFFKPVILSDTINMQINENRLQLLNKTNSVYAEGLANVQLTQRKYKSPPCNKTHLVTKVALFATNAVASLAKKDVRSLWNNDMNPALLDSLFQSSWSVQRAGEKTLVPSYALCFWTSKEHITEFMLSAKVVCEKNALISSFCVECMENVVGITSGLVGKEIKLNNGKMLHDSNASALLMAETSFWATHVADSPKSSSVLSKSKHLTVQAGACMITLQHNVYFQNNTPFHNNFTVNTRNAFDSAARSAQRERTSTKTVPANNCVSLLVRLKRNSLALSNPSAPFTAISGGTSGLGSLVSTLALRCGSVPLLLSRTGQLPEISLPSCRDMCMVVKNDVSMKESAPLLRDLHARFASTLSFVHAGGVLADALLSNQNISKYRLTSAPKLHGLQNVINVECICSFGYVVAFSSISAWLGGIAQANYSMVNAMMDNMCIDLQNNGLAATSIQWGAWGSVGVAVQASGTLMRAEKAGLGIIKPQDGLRAFSEVIARITYPVVLCSPFNLQRLSQELPDDAARFEASQDKKQHKVAQQVLKRTKDFTEEVRALAAGLTGGEVAADEPFMGAGMDSLGAVELRNVLSQRYNVSLPATVMFDYPTASALGLYLSGLQEDAPEGRHDEPRDAVATAAAHGGRAGLPSREEVCKQIVGIVEGMLGREVDPSMPFMEAGLDSLASVELMNAVAGRFQVSLGATAMFDYPTALALADVVSRELGDVSRVEDVMLAPVGSRPAEVSKDVWVAAIKSFFCPAVCPGG